MSKVIHIAPVATLVQKAFNSLMVLAHRSATTHTEAPQASMIKGTLYCARKHNIQMPDCSRAVDTEIPFTHVSAQDPEEAGEGAEESTSQGLLQGLQRGLWGSYLCGGGTMRGVVREGV